MKYVKEKQTERELIAGPHFHENTQRCKSLTTYMVQIIKKIKPLSILTLVQLSDHEFNPIRCRGNRKDNKSFNSFVIGGNIWPTIMNH